VSPTPAQRRGTRYEKRAAAALRKDGYFVMEARASKGLADLLALKIGQVLMVQVKSGDADLADGWFNELFDAATRHGAMAVIADYPRAGKLRLRRIIGPHNYRSPRWPCVPMITDEAAGGRRAP
jgi:Holliday junction resolvase